MSYRFLNDAQADVAIEAVGKTREELFESAGKALFEVVGNNPPKEPLRQVSFSVKAPQLEDLLRKWLNELIYIKDNKRLYIAHFNFQFLEQDGQLVVQSRLQGVPLNIMQSHHFRVDPKGIALHGFSLKKQKTGLTAKFIVDV